MNDHWLVIKFDWIKKVERGEKAQLNESIQIKKQAGLPVLPALRYRKN
jgi:hypothetical protein